MRTRLVGVFAAALAATSVLTARQDRQLRPPAFRVSVDHVELDVVVTDKKDKPVLGLAQSDFEVVENKRPQVISDFQRFEPSSFLTRSSITDAPDAPGQAVASAPGSRLFVVILDDLHILETHLVETSRAALGFLHSLTPLDYVAIVFTGRSDLDQNFTNDRALHDAAVARLRQAAGFALSPVPVIGESPNRTVRRRFAESTLDTLRNVSAALRQSMQPRKAIVLFSEGFDFDPTPPIRQQGLIPVSSLEPIDARSVSQELSKTLEASAEAGVPIYTVDPRGLVTVDSAVRSGSELNPPVDVNANEALDRIRREEWQRRLRDNIARQQSFMRNVAERTGGIAIVNRGNVLSGIAEVVSDNSAFYLLGFYPNPFVQDGKFHEVTVRVKKPDVKIRARKGYFAPPASRGGGLP